MKTLKTLFFETPACFCGSDADDELLNPTQKTLESSPRLRARSQKLKRLARDAEQLAAEADASKGTFDQAEEPMKIENAADFPGMGRALYIFFVTFLCGSTWNYSLFVSIPVLTAIIMPEYAAQASSALVGATFIFDAIAGLFVSELTEHTQSLRPGFFFAGACSFCSSLLLIAALVYDRISLLLVAVGVFATGVQTCLHLATQLMTTFTTVAPERAESLEGGMLLSMNLSGLLGTLAIWLAPINPGPGAPHAMSRLWVWFGATLPDGWTERIGALWSESTDQLHELIARGGLDFSALGVMWESLPGIELPGIDLTMVYTHLALNILGLLLLSRVPSTLLSARAFVQVPEPPRPRSRSAFEIVDATLSGICQFFCSRDYRSLVILGVTVGCINSVVGGLLASTIYYAEDWTDMDGAEVQRQNALSVSIGSLVSTLITMPMSKYIDRCNKMVVICVASVAFVGLYGSLALRPSELLFRIFWASSFLPFFLYSVVVIPFSIQANLFPDPNKISHDIALQGVIGGFVSAGLSILPGVLLANGVDSDAAMLGGRLRYSLESYQVVLLVLGTGTPLLSPLMLQLAACIHPTPRESEDFPGREPTVLL